MYLFIDSDADRGGLFALIHGATVSIKLRSRRKVGSQTVVSAAVKTGRKRRKRSERRGGPDRREERLFLSIVNVGFS